MPAPYYHLFSDYLLGVQKNKSPPPVNNCTNDGHGAMAYACEIVSGRNVCVCALHVNNGIFIMEIFFSSRNVKLLFQHLCK